MSQMKKMGTMHSLRFFISHICSQNIQFLDGKNYMTLE